MRLIDADAFDRALANHEFSAALNEAASNDMAFKEIPMLYSTQSFRDVMSYRPTIDAIPVEWLRKWPKDLREGAYVRDILRDWQKEQEART